MAHLNSLIRKKQTGPFQHLPLFLFCPLIVALVGCTAQSSNPNEKRNTNSLSQNPPTAKDFNGYWFAGKAELSRYELKQARYGEIHNGDAVLVFVTEDFRTDTQVKLESASDGNDTPVLKLNFLKKFPTGIYDYSMMASIFSPIDLKAYPRSLKVNCTSQDWCGQTFTQLNLRKGNYTLNEFSYFEREGDNYTSLVATTLEDEIWTRIRLNPDELPVGAVEMIPGIMASRLRHRPLKVEKAQARFEKYTGNEFQGTRLKTYVVEYPESNRTLAITFDEVFPYSIAGWQETYQSGWGANAKELTTTATRTHFLLNDYWNLNGVSDAPLRDQLGL